MTSNSSSISNLSKQQSNEDNSRLNSDLIKTKQELNFNSLSDILMNKVGPTHTIGYLGSAILTKGKTGLGSLQQPLRELYCIFRQNGSRLMQERRLVVSLDGLTMLFNELGVEKFIHNDLSSVYEVELLRLVSETRKDKKTYYAFLPIEQEPDICYSNLFQSLDKHYVRYLENTSHPPIIALIMRRSVGIQALECHVLITRTPNEAITIVNDIKNVCKKYKYELNQQTKLFQYKPYNENNQTNQESSDQQKSQNIKPAKKINQLPPKSPFIKPNKKSNSKNDDKNDIIYDAYKESSQLIKPSNSEEIDARLSAKSVTNSSESTKSNSSLFNKIKNNLKDKSSVSNHDLSKNKNSKKEKENKTLLASNSEVLFTEINSNKKSNNLYEKKDSSGKQSRPSSALGNLIQNQENKNLKQSSLTSLALSDDGVSVKSGSESKKDKKLSLGKRLILSARSSLKSNSSSGLKSSSKTSMSNSATSLNTIMSHKSKKDLEKIGDVDFRKSKTSIVDDNLLIDGSLFGPVTLIQANQQQRSASSSVRLDNRSQTPGSICLENRINLISPNDGNFVLKSRPTTSTNQVLVHSSNRINNQQTMQNRPASIASVNRINRDYTNVESTVTNEESKILSHDSRYQKKNFKYPVADPKLLSNHLVWNKAIGTAESVDYEKKAQINNNHVARVISTGGLTSNKANFVTSREFFRKNEVSNTNKNNIQMEQKHVVRSKSHSMESNEVSNNIKIRPKPPSSLVPEFNLNSISSKEYSSSLNPYSQYSPGSVTTTHQQTKLFSQQSSKLHDSAYNTNSSTDDQNSDRTSYKSAFTAREKSIDSFGANRVSEKNTNEHNISVLNRLMQEEEEHKRTKMVLSSHKIIGGVKVFPSLPHEYKQAAEQRQKRFAEIESNIKNTSNIEYQLKQKCNLNEYNSCLLESTEHDNEIIDLTNIKEVKINAETSSISSSTQFKEIPIEIVTDNCNQTKNSKSTKGLLTINEMLGNPDHLDLNVYKSTTNDICTSKEEYDEKQKMNYIYYYDNQHFCGY